MIRNVVALGIVVVASAMLQQSPAGSIFGVAVAAAQAPPPTFDVASVKVSPPLPPGGARVIAGSVQPGGRWVSVNAPFIDILRAVYPEYALKGLIAGGPESVTGSRFDIDARADGTASPAQMAEMVKQLLADRFGLRVHAEPHEIDTYALIVARNGGRLGDGMRPSSVDCELVAAARARGEAPQGAGGRSLCTALGRQQPNGTVRVTGDGARVPHLIAMIQGVVREPIIDRTGLTGRYDMDLEFNPALGVGLAAGDPSDASGSSLFTALQDVGLRLDQRKATMNILIIDSAHMPTPD